MTTYGVTPKGFNAPSGVEIYVALTEAFQQQFPTIDTSPQSITGQFIAIFSKTIADIWDNMFAVYGAAYPASAQGIALDGIAQIVGVVRKAASYTQTYLTCTGLQGTVIPQGSAVSSSAQGSSLFLTSTQLTISPAFCSTALISISTPSAIRYTLIINNTQCSYYELLETFAGGFVAGNDTAITINGNYIGSVPFNTDDATTISDIVNLINAATPLLATASSPAPDQILLIPSAGVTLLVTIIITGGISQPTVTETLYTPAGTASVQSGLISVINASAASSACVASASGSAILLTATQLNSPFSLLLSSGLTLTSLSSPVLAVCEDTGAIDAPTNTLTTIATPVYGWQSVNNPTAPVLGSPVETDAELRLRIFSASASAAYATVAALTAKLLAVVGVTYADVLENTTLTQLSTTIQFSAPFSTGNTIAMSLNGVAVPTVLYAGSQAGTMAAIEAALLTNNSVLSVSTPTSTSLSINWKPITTTKITLLTVVGGATVPSATFSDGIPPLSVECIVVGTNPQLIGQCIYDTKAAGVQTFGNTSVVVNTPSQTTSTVYYQSPVPVYIWVYCVITGKTSAFAGAQAVQSAILAFGSSLQVGNTVYYGQVNAVPFLVSGVTAATLTIAYTATSTQDPTGTFGTQNITILQTQISNWAASRILVTVA